MTKAMKLGLAAAILAVAMPMQAGADDTGARASHQVSDDIPTFAEFEEKCRSNSTNSTDCGTLFNHGAEYADEAMDESSCDFTAFWAKRDSLSEGNFGSQNWDVAIGELINMGACTA